MQVCLMAAAALIQSAVADMDPVSYNHFPEAHHSMKPPLDRTQVYWNFGGSTVVTRKLIRLTPDTQDRRGWLWNEYPIESENWEMEFHFEAYSNPHFGGDGFGFFIMSGDQDPTFSTEPDFLNGPIFGMKSDFQGVGVMFDVYDNDNKRNNPSVFVLDNMQGDREFNHDNDYEDDMEKTTPEHVPGHVGSDDTAYRAHKCVADFRNSGKSNKALVKYLHKVMHVYIDSQEGEGYKFCLAVEMNHSFVDYHFAFAAATGQVADIHDLKEVTVRYLSEADKEFDDSLMTHYGASRSKPWSTTFFAFATLITVALVGLTVWQLMLLRTLSGARIDLVRICKLLNDLTIPHWCAHVFLCVLLLCLVQWIPVLMNIPTLAIRVYLLSTNQVRFSETSISGQAVKGHRAEDLTAFMRLVVNAVLYVPLCLFCLFRCFF